LAIGEARASQFNSELKMTHEAALVPILDKCANREYLVALQTQCVRHPPPTCKGWASRSWSPARHIWSPEAQRMRTRLSFRHF